jgi:predicted nuclease of predicted toxin-antitoxin system
MKIKLDENMPSDLGALLASQGHDVETVAGENLAGADDTLIMQKGHTGRPVAHDFRPRVCRHQEV